MYMTMELELVKQYATVSHSKLLSCHCPWPDLEFVFGKDPKYQALLAELGTYVYDYGIRACETVCYGKSFLTLILSLTLA